MRSSLAISAIIVAILLAGGVVISGSPDPAPGVLPVYHYAVVHSYPHDRFAFTEGLAWSDDMLYEGTGLEGNSTIRHVDLATGTVLAEQNLSDLDFGEGIAAYGNTLVQITETSGIGYLYNRSTLKPEGSFRYATEGWGLTFDGQHLVMSDGTATLYLIDPGTFRQLGKINVTAAGVPVTSLNELEYVNGYIYANIWPTNRIAIIAPETGSVTGWIDLTGLPPARDRALIGWQAIDRLRGHTSIPFVEEACPNGIAYDTAGDRLFVTGKLWPELFEIRLVPEQTI